MEMIFFMVLLLVQQQKKMFLKLKDFQLDIPVSVFVSDLIFFFFNFTSMPIEGHTTD